MEMTSKIQVSSGLDPINVTATGAGATLDRASHPGEVEIVFACGLSGDTLTGSNHWELHVQESADDSTFTAVANADIKGGTVVATAVGTVVDLDAMTKDNTVYRRGYLGTARYVRGIQTEVGTLTSGMPTCILYITGRHERRPTSSP